MAVTMCCPTEKEWGILKKYFNRAPSAGLDGLVFVSLDMQEMLDLEDGQQVTYDFGGEPDIWTDLIQDPEDYGVKVLKSHEQLSETALANLKEAADE